MCVCVRRVTITKDSLLQKRSRESPLLFMMNKLDRDQRLLVEENNNLKRQLTASNGQVIPPGFEGRFWGVLLGSRTIPARLEKSAG